jgi:Helicase associated domain
LDELGFVWDPFESDWEKGFAYLKRYREREGDCNVPALHQENGFRLGQWVRVQRVHRSTMQRERQQRLEALGFIWDPKDVAWEDAFAYLRHYKQRVGHCRVPKSHKESGFRLGDWVDRQRQAKHALSDERRRRLDERGFVWNPMIADWEQGIGYLKQYHEREGHCRVPNSHQESGFRLGQWCTTNVKVRNDFRPCRDGHWRYLDLFGIQGVRFGTNALAI